MKLYRFDQLSDKDRMRLEVDFGGTPIEINEDIEKEFRREFVGYPHEGRFNYWVTPTHLIKWLKTKSIINLINGE